MPAQRPLLAALLAMSILAPATSAETLYRWTDAAGRPHISDQPPAAASGPVEEITVPTYGDSGASNDYYAIPNQLRRLQEARMAEQRARQERARQAREQALREREVAAAERLAEQAEQSARPPVYVLPRRIHRPIHRHYPPAPPPANRPRTLWPPEHPAYRVTPRAQPAPSARAGY